MHKVEAGAVALLRDLVGIDSVNPGHSEAVIDALPGLGVRPDACLIAEPTDLAPCRSLRGW